ncbi:MAG: efflux RND transporter permease subunit, partial [Desulfobacterales bacterium]|nr:efflux RND transporter permease subunit [Desulfobacterales bacterium]
MTSVPGVSEVASIGGFVKQYQVEVDPNKLLAYNLSISRVKNAIQRSNNDVGGRLIEMGETEFMVRGLGYIRSMEDLAQVTVGVDENGTPILLSTIANIQIGPELRRGILEWNGRGEVAGGIIVMRYGENALEVIQRVKQKLTELNKGLPEGVVIRMGYDRSGLIQRAIHTLTTKLIEEMVVVAMVCVVFLLHFRSAFVAILTLPTGILASLLLMYLLDININIMSLGGIAIAIGVMVDASVVMVENTHKHLERDRGKKPRDQIIRDASKEVGPALFYSLLIITISFLPVFSLGEQSGRLFKPLAYTKTFAMGASAILAVTIIPVLMTFFIKGNILPEQKSPISRVLIRMYMPLIRGVLKYRKTTLVLTLLVMVATALPAGRLGSEFMPPLNEGDLLYMPTTLPGISVTKAREILQQTDKIIMKFPEVKHVLGKIGRAETATDPAPLSMIESTIMLHPQDLWRNRPVPRFFSDWPPILKTPLSL